MDFALGPIVALHGVAAEADAGVAGIQGKCDRDHDEQFHAFGLILDPEF